MPIVLENYAHSFRQAKPNVLERYTYYFKKIGHYFGKVMPITWAQWEFIPNRNLKTDLC